MDLGRLLQVLFTRSLRITACATIVVLLALVAHALLPPRYTASASVVVDVSNINPVLGVAGSSSLMARTVVSTQLSVLRSEGVAQQVVRRLGLQDDPAWHEGWMRAGQGAGDLVAWSALQLLRALDVRASSEDGSVIDIRFSAREREFAAAVANAFAEVYLEESARLRATTARGQSQFFKTHVAELGEGLSKAQAALSAYQRKHGIVISDEKLDVETAALNALTNQALASREASIDAASRSEGASSGTGPAADVMNHPNVQRLTGVLQEAQRHMSELGGRLQPTHPEMVAARQSVEAAREALAREEARVASTLKTGVEINRRHEAQVRNALEAQRQRVMALKAQRDAMAVLERDVESAQQAYDQARVRLNETSQEGSSTAPAASLLTRATAPVESSRPGRVQALAIALVVGLLLGGLWTVMDELRRPRIHQLDDLKALGLPTVVALPAGRQRRMPQALGWTRLKRTLA